MADEDGAKPARREQESPPSSTPREPERGEDFEFVDHSQLPGPSELRSVARPRAAAAEGWSAPILSLARRATGNLSASCGNALRAATGLGSADGGADGVARAGRLRPRAPEPPTGPSVTAAGSREGGRGAAPVVREQSREPVVSTLP